MTTSDGRPSLTEMMAYPRPPMEELLSMFQLASVHPVADMFPMMTEEELTGLVEHANINGFTTRVVATDDGVLLDGRNRLLASWIIRNDVGIRRLNPSAPDEWILAENLHRRNLTTGQKALLGNALLEWREAEARQRMAEAGRSSAPFRPAGKGQADRPDLSRPAPQSRDLAAAQVGTSGRAVGRAERVTREAPDLVPAIQSGAMTLNKAEREVVRRERAIPRAEPAPKPTATMLTLSGIISGKPVDVPYPKPQGKPMFNPTNESVSWASWTWNPVTGCLHGCGYCYAREIAMLERSRTSYPLGFEPLFHAERLGAPANHRVPASAADEPRDGRVFVCSMADLYGQWVPAEWIDQVHAVCTANPQWEYLMLTKFPRRYVGLQLPPTAWLGTSVDEQKRVRLAEDAFREISGVAVKWLSLEPLLAPLEFTDLSMFDWVVIGSQTQTRQPNVGIVEAVAPPFDWVARIVDQAREAGCKVYLKPNLLGVTGPNSPGMILPQEVPLGGRGAR